MSRDFDLRGVVAPWGRSAAEYEAFFALADVPPSARVLDCGGGPASFNAQWSRRGRFVVAADPIHRRTAGDIIAEFEPTATRMLEGMREAQDRFRWDHYGGAEAVVERRRDFRSAAYAIPMTSGAAKASQKYLKFLARQSTFSPQPWHA